MDVLIIRPKKSGYCCQLQGVYFGLFYADDRMLLSHSLGAMRYVLTSISRLPYRPELSMGWVDQWVGLVWVNYSKSTNNLKGFVLAF